MRVVFDEGDVVQTKLGSKFKIEALKELHKGYTTYKAVQLFEDKKCQTFSEAVFPTELYDDCNGSFSYVMSFEQFAKSAKQEELKQLS